MWGFNRVTVKIPKLHHEDFRCEDYLINAPTLADPQAPAGEPTPSVFVTCWFRWIFHQPSACRCLWSPVAPTLVNLSLTLQLASKNERQPMIWRGGWVFNYPRRTKSISGVPGVAWEHNPLLIYIYTYVYVYVYIYTYI